MPVQVFNPPSILRAGHRTKTGPSVPDALAISDHHRDSLYSTVRRFVKYYLQGPHSNGELSAEARSTQRKEFASKK
jgi:hypothetical protein